MHSSDPLPYPTDLKIVSLLPNAIAYQWSKTNAVVQNEPVIGYIYHFFDGVQKMKTGFISTSEKPQHTVENFEQQANSYTFSVAAISTSGNSLHCPPLAAGPPPVGN